RRGALLAPDTFRRRHFIKRDMRDLADTDTRKWRLARRYAFGANLTRTGRLDHGSRPRAVAGIACVGANTDARRGELLDADPACGPQPDRIPLPHRRKIC